MYKLNIIDDAISGSESFNLLLKECATNFVVGKPWNKPEDFLVHLTNKNIAPPDIVLIDYKMPVLKGWQVSYLLQQYYPHIKKIGFSSDNDEEWTAQFLKTGCKGFVSKSSRPSELIPNYSLATIDVF